MAIGDNAVVVALSLAYVARLYLPCAPVVECLFPIIWGQLDAGVERLVEDGVFQAQPVRTVL